LHHIVTVLQPFFQDYAGEPVPKQKLLDFMAQGKINRGRHTDHPTGRHSIQTNQCPPPPSPQRTSKNVAVTVDMAQLQYFFESNNTTYLTKYRKVPMHKNTLDTAAWSQVST